MSDVKRKGMAEWARVLVPLVLALCGWIYSLGAQSSSIQDQETRLGKVESWKDLHQQEVGALFEAVNSLKLSVDKLERSVEALNRRLDRRTPP